MKKLTLAVAAIAALGTAPVFAQAVTPRVIDTNPVLPEGISGNAVTMIRAAGQDPVLISGDEVISAVQPLDLNLTPVPGMEFAFTNQSGQIVIVAPAGTSIQYFDN